MSLAEKGFDCFVKAECPICTLVSLRNTEVHNSLSRYSGIIFAFDGSQFLEHVSQRLRWYSMWIVGGIVGMCTCTAELSCGLRHQ